MAETNPSLPVIDSKLAPPPERGTIGQTSYCTTFQHVSGERRILRRGRTTHGYHLHLQEAFPDGCPCCVGRVAEWVEYGDGSLETLFSASSPANLCDFWASEWCERCRWKYAAKAAKEFLQSLQRARFAEGQHLAVGDAIRGAKRIIEHVKEGR